MILVTSATGTIGSEIVKILKAQNVPVTGASREPAKAQAALGVPVAAWDWTRPQAFADALKGIQTLFLGTPPGTTDEKSYGLSAVAAAKRAGVKKIVKLSAIGIENMPDSPHRQIELGIEESGLQWVFLRPSFFMQNLNEGMVESIKHASCISAPCGDGKTGVIDARDIAAVAVVALTSDKLNGQGLTLTGPEALSYGEMAAQLGQAIGRTLRHDDPAPEAYTAYLLKAGMPRHYAQFMTTLYNQVVRNGYASTVTDSVQKVTGKAPIRFTQYAGDYASAFKA